MADPTVISNLTKQLLASSDPTKWTGAGFGSAENNAADMAKILSGIGITDIKQFGEIPTYEKLAYGYNGQPVTKNADGTFSILVPETTVDGMATGNTVPVTVPADKVQIGRVIPGASGGDYTEADTFAPVDASKIVMQNGQPVVQTGTTYGNKETGQTVGNTYGERQIGNAWGGTYAGSGNTGYRVQFDAQGNPHFYTTGASSSNAADYAPLLAIGSMAFGLPGILGGALNSGIGLGLGAAGEAALGGAIAGGGIAGLTGQDVLKGAVLGGLGGYAQGSGMFSGTDPNMTFNAGAENVFDPNAAGMPLDIGAGGGNPYAGTPTVSGAENVFDPGTTYNAGDENVFDPGTTYNAGNENVFDPNSAVKYDVVVPEGASKDFFPIGGENANPNLTPAAIESGLGSPGYGVNAGAMASGLFNPATIGAGAAAGAASSGLSSLLGKAAVSALLGGGAKAVIDAANKTTTGAGGGGGDGFNPVGGYTFNPSMFQASVPNPNDFRPGSEVVTVADAVRRAQAAQQQQPVAMAEGGQASSKPKYTAKAQLAAMSPWERAAAQFNNAAYAARMPVGAQMPQGNIQQLGSFARGGGISDLGAYSDGGRMLKGPGDGMSDSIPARIGAHREARLADGEFVIPADVVSGLGNGSTDAGAKQLYKMMDRVRMARTGSKKQGREINADKQLPV